MPFHSERSSESLLRTKLLNMEINWTCANEPIRSVYWQIAGSVVFAGTSHPESGLYILQGQILSAVGPRSFLFSYLQLFVATEAGIQDSGQGRSSCVSKTDNNLV